MATYGRRIRADFYSAKKKEHITIDGRRRILHRDKFGNVYIINKGRKMYIGDIK